MVGIGGYGYFYLKTLYEEMPSVARLCGVVDPLARSSGHYARLLEDHIPVFDEIESYFEAGYGADLAVIASPIQYHVHQSCISLQHGAHVLCDKPVAAVVQDADQLIQAALDSGRWCGIGYQWSYSSAIQMLKRDIRSGRFGKPQRLKTLILWPRDDAYYQRNDWAGKIRGAGGEWILDSPANNAMAHYLHNLFYLLGEDTARSARPTDVVAELYRANPIENCDTVALRAHTDGGAELLFYGSHATYTARNPMFHLEFENALVSFNETSPEITVQMRAGAVSSYGSPEDDAQFKKLFDAVDAVRTLKPPVCPPEAARAQCVCVNGMQESMETIGCFPSSIIRRDEEKKWWWVDGLDDALINCYRQNSLPFEMGVAWARRGVAVDLRTYVRYPSSKVQT